MLKNIRISNFPLKIWEAGHEIVRRGESKSTLRKSATAAIFYTFWNGGRRRGISTKIVRVILIRLIERLKKTTARGVFE